MNFDGLVSRLSALPPEVLICDRVAGPRIVHAIYDDADEPRREVFIMSALTWGAVEYTATMLSPHAVGRWRVRSAESAGVLLRTPDGEWFLIIRLPPPSQYVKMIASEDDMVAAAAPPQPRKWRIAL